MTEPIRPATRIGPYEIVGWLGAGGMGEVYRARDPRLGRDVALKLITGPLSGDPGRVRRFEQEARAAGQLNHPNVLAVYDTAVHDGVPYIVSELLEGRSLRSRLADGALPWRKALDYAKQIAEGLAAAHDRGIVHRDVKPENLFITTDGRIKILDFGIAKLVATGDEPAGAGMGLSTDTAAGAVVGTAAYMSPEQVRGENVDARSDIFSLGSVIYEMIAGRPAFVRETPAETMTAILREDPPPPPPNADAPALARIVERCLEKSRETRFQSARDLAFGLDVLSGTQATATIAVIPRRRGVTAAAMMIAAGILIGVPAMWLTSRAPGPIEDLLATARWSWFTDFEGSSEIDATISPDGKVVAFMADRDGGPFHVWVKQVGTGPFRDLTPDRADLWDVGFVRNIGFNFDGSELWLNGTQGPPVRPLTLLPIMGGAARPFLAQNTGNVTWSPDGKRLAYFTRDGDPIIVAEADDSNESQILARKNRDDHNHWLVFSPDSHWIYYAHAEKSLTEFDIYRIPAAGGAPEAMATLHTDVRDLTPIDNRSVLFVAHDKDGSGPWLWVLDVDRKQTHRVSVGLERYLSVAASADGRHLVASIVKSTAAGLWSIPIRDAVVEEREVTPFKMSSARALSPRFGPDSTLFYLSSSGGGDGLWRIQDGQAVDIRLGASAPIVETPSVSRDGSRVAVVIGTPGKRRITVVSADGTNRRPLSDAVDVRGTSAWSLDGTSIITAGTDERGPGLFSVPVDGGAPRRLMSGAAADPVLSPDGKVIVYSGARTPTAPLLAIRLDGTPVPLPEIRPGGRGGLFRFLPDGRLVYLQSGSGKQDFWLLDIPTRHTRQMTKLSNLATINTFDISPDGSRIVFDRVRDLADVALIDLAKR